MCGIAGYVDFSSPARRRVVNAMIGSIEYRGPDSSGIYIDKNNNTALGIRRLSIIDLKTGDQPIYNEDKSIVVVYNGEIYNYKELKKDLLERGHKFKTKSDTEVIVHLYEEYSEKMPKRLNGMFAFSLWDENKQKLFIARDRAGIKPLYYYNKGDLFVYGSELKTILKHPKVKKQIDKESLKLYGYFGYVPGKYAIFRGIKKLPPGHSLTYQKGRLSIKKYFELDLNRDNEIKSLDEILGRAVEMQLHADVPVGVFLSGGLDSSLIAYYISKHKKLKSFSISFGSERFDESKHAKYVSSKLGTEHYDERFTAEDAIRIFSKVSKKLDEPLSDASILPTFKVSEFAKRHVKVALSGDGGDELFGGYPTYQAHIMSSYLNFLPKPAVSAFLSFLSVVPEGVVNLMPASFKDYSKKELATIVLKGVKLSDPERHFYWMRTFFLGHNPLFDKPSTKTLNSLVKGAEKVRNPSLRGQYIDYHSYLPGDFLVKSDRASMFNSLEVRVPFLDNNVIDYAFSKNVDHVNLSSTKIQMRNLLETELPAIAKRPKKGFGIPLDDWMKKELKDLIYSEITSEKLYDYVEKEKIMGLWREHQEGSKNNGGALWQLTVLSGWLRNWA